MNLKTVAVTPKIKAYGDFTRPTLTESRLSEIREICEAQAGQTRIALRQLLTQLGDDVLIRPRFEDIRRLADQQTDKELRKAFFQLIAEIEVLNNWAGPYKPEG